MSSAIRRHNGEAGFSLAEVLVALAIAAMMAAVLMRFVAGTRANAIKVAELTEMAALGETLLARVPSSRHLRPGRTDGRAGVFAWRMDIAPVSFTAQALRVSEKAAAAKASGPPAGGNWASYSVALVIEAPSGRRYAIDTIRLGPGDR